MWEAIERTLHTIMPLLGGAMGAGVLSFIQFLIQRRDGREDKLDGIRKAVEKTNSRIDGLEASQKQKDAEDARRQVLLFADEIRREIAHSEESFNQVLDDIHTYENYCRIHEEYQNNKAMGSIQLVIDTYYQCKKSNNFI